MDFEILEGKGEGGEGQRLRTTFGRKMKVPEEWDSFTNSLHSGWMDIFCQTTLNGNHLVYIWTKQMIN